MHVDDSPERIHEQLEGFAAEESKGGEVTVSRVQHVRVSPVSPIKGNGYKLVKQAAEETLTGPQVGFLTSTASSIGIYVESSVESRPRLLIVRTY